MLLDDPARLAALLSYRVLDTPPEPQFDDIVALARTVCRAPMALFSLMAADRQWTKARVGIDDLSETPLDQSVCVHAIREPEISEVVSSVARVPEVRSDLIARFRAIIAGEERPGIVVEGRDITTVVAPDAPVRILLTASEAVRMSRRAAELTGHYAAKTGEQLRARDVADSKVVDFMNAAEGVTVVDSTELDFGQTIDAVIAVIEAGGR